MFYRIIKSFLTPIAVLIIHFIATYLNLYIIYQWLDIPMHLLGGVAVGFTFTDLISLAKKEKLVGKNNGFIEFLFVISLVALTAILWEFLEFSLEAITFLEVQGGLPDTILDLFLGLVGAPLGFLSATKDRN